MLIGYSLFVFAFSSLFSASYGQFCSFESCYGSEGKAKACLSPPVTVSLQRNVTVTNTCGEKEREKYCPLSGATCKYCDASNPSEKHPVNFLVDTDDSTWWQSQNWRDTTKDGLTTSSKPLKVNITLNFGKSYIISGHIQITFYSERPGAMILERSVDDGHTWKTLQYFAKRCDRFYNMPTENSVNSADPFKIQCSEKYSTETPRQFGKVVYNGDTRYQGCNFMSTAVQSGLLATNIRVRLEYPATDGLEIHGNDEAMLKYYYAISDIEITGRCHCHGHANSCTGSRMDRKCSCQHNTMGIDCEACKPLFNNRPWMTANGTHGNECQECNCNNHGTGCIYNGTLGYGQCTGCRNNTEGNHCEKCVDMYYRDLNKPMNDSSACIACGCFPDGIINNGSCLQNATSAHPIGQCACKPNVYGRQCNQCKPGHWGFTLPPQGECRTCNCNTLGTKGGSVECDQLTGQCNCKDTTQGQQCQECKLEHYRYPQAQGEGCRRCPCDLGGAYPGCQKKTGSCHCRHGVEGNQCTYPSPGRFYPALDYLLFEAESATGTFISNTPTSAMGSAFTGRGYAELPPGKMVHFSNIKVKVTNKYTVIVRYSASGQCTYGNTTFNITGPNVNEVKVIPASDIILGNGRAGQLPELVTLVSGEDYNVTVSFNGSSDCKVLIDSLVVIPYVNASRVFTMSAQHHQNTLMQCVTRRASLSSIPTEPANCSKLVFSASTQIYNGTLECNCNAEGSNNGSYCAAYGGQCQCKPGVGGRSCDYCLPGYYGFSSTGCTKCGCSPDGSLSSLCDVQAGLCKCKVDVIGAKCDQCKANYFNADASNTQGCQQCFGYGHSTGCSSAEGFVTDYRRTSFDSSADRLAGWTVVDEHGGLVNFTDSWKNGLIITTPPSLSAVYIDAPKEFLGNKLYSYKQTVSINMQITNTSVSSSIIKAADVMLIGRGLNASLSFRTTPSKDNDNYDVILDEHHVTSPWKVTPFEFQSMLTELASLRIRATYYPSPHGSVKFLNISLTHAVEKERAQVSGLNVPVNNVENSTCHRNYTGLSCEKCAKGYTREVPHGDPFSRCVLCSCNGRSTTCDGQSGNCTNCQVGTYGDKCQSCENNVLGPHCTECKPGHWALSRSGCKACACNTLGTWYSNSTSCNKVTGQCACNATMNVDGRRCDRCKENSYNASEGISDCRECSSCYGFLQTDVHQLRTQATQLTNLTIDHAQHPVMQHAKSFATRLQEVLHKVRGRMATVSIAASNDKSFAVQWTALEQAFVTLETKVKVNLSSAINTSSEIGSQVEANHQMISKTISEVIDLVNTGYRLVNTTIVQRLGINLDILNGIAQELVPLPREAHNLLTSTQINNQTLQSGINKAVGRANLANSNARAVQLNNQQFSPYLPRLLNNVTLTKTLGEDAQKMGEYRLHNVTAVLNDTKELNQRVGLENPDNQKTVQDLNSRSSEITAASNNYVNQSMTFWASSSTVLTQVYAAIARARGLIDECTRIEQNVTMQRTSAALSYQIATNATDLANQIHRETVFMRDVLKNFHSMSKEVESRANASLTKVFGIERGITEVITNASSVNASIHEAVVASKRAVQLATEAKKLAGDELEALTKALGRAERLKHETKAKEEVIANQTVRNYIRTEIEPVEKLCQNLTNAANQIASKASEALRQANETDTKSRRIIDQLRTASTQSPSLSMPNDNEIMALKAEVERVRQRFISLNMKPSITKLQAKLQEHKGKYEEYKTKKASLKADVEQMKRLIKSFATVNSQC